ncbi:DNA-directed RNA polymerase subunit L [archaeon]|nr:DNA-directed RNA polymerase subunit L [archaeon]
MTLKILNETTKSMQFELEGEQHTFPALLCWALLKDPRVSFAVYNVDHPLIGIPQITLRTERKKPMNALLDATKLLDKEFKEIDKQLGKTAKSTKKKKK